MRTRLNHYDYLVVGSGLYGSIFSYLANKNGKHTLVIDKRNHIGGNVYTEKQNNINIHKYGAHIFHTSNKEIWDFVTSISKFESYVNQPIANYKGKLYNLPFNMNTFHQIYGVQLPDEAKQYIDNVRTHFENPKNLEEQALNLVGKDIYEILIKGYTEKQWGRKCTELPPEIIKRLPLRFTFDNNYFNDIYQGIPANGYTEFISKLLTDTEVITNTSYDNSMYNLADKIIYTGSIDEYFNYQLGNLEYRSVKFENKEYQIDNYQGVAVMNYTSNDIPYTRCIEHKHFSRNINTNNTIVSYEYPIEWKPGIDPYYPINNTKNIELYNKYIELSKNDKKVFFGGRLGKYKYFDMDKTIEEAFKDFEEINK